MSERVGLSKRIRFEVFKRDSFTCQYCGQKAPDVILNVDHINPVANGGDNDIMNLVTSCFECNNGKSDKTLDDKSTVEKQRKQLEALQERREQIELLIEWKRSLSTLENDVELMILTYIESKIPKYHINDNGKKSIKQLINKFDLSIILDSIDESSKKYLKYDNNGDLTKESVADYFNKIGGMVAIKTMPPIKQKIAYIKGIARNRFSYWDDRKGAIILNNYVEALENHWNEATILNDLETEVIKITKEAANWTDWRSTLENWTEDIKKWPKKTEPIVTSDTPKEFLLDELKQRAYSVDFNQASCIAAILYIGKAFPDFDADFFLESLLEKLDDFLIEYNNFSVEREDFDDMFWDYLDASALEIFFGYNTQEDPKKNVHIFKLKNIIFDLLYETFEYYYFSPKIYTKKDVDILIMIHKNNSKTKKDLLKQHL